jgi:post-segregation antitoxin (ccd killing protein)
MTQIISVRIDDSLYEQLKKHNINLSVVVRKSLEMEVSNIERELLVKKIKSLSERFRDESLGNFLMVDKNRRKER